MSLTEEYYTEEYYNEIVSWTYNDWLIILVIIVSGWWLAGYLKHNKISLISNKKRKKFQSLDKKLFEFVDTWWIPFLLIFAFLMTVYEYFVSLLN